MATLKDCLFNADFRRTHRAMMRVVSKLQANFPAEEQVAGVGLLLLLLCEFFSANVRDVLDIVSRQLREAAEKHPEETNALRMYIENELVKGGEG